MLRLALLTALASVLLAATGIALYARAEVASSSNFSARAASALDDAAVRTALAERIVSALSERVASDALVVRPLAVAAVASLAGTAPVRRAVATAVERRHAALLADESSVRLALAPADPLLAALLAAVSRRAVERLPVDPSVRLGALRPHSFELTVAAVARRMAAWAPWLLAAALLSLAATAMLAGSVRAAALSVGAALAGAGILVAALVVIGGEWLVARTPSLDPAAVRGLWSALLGDLRTAGMAVAAGGTIAAVVAAGGAVFARAGRAARATWRRSRAQPRARAAASAAMLLAGLALLLAPATALRVLAVTLGGVLALLGVARLAGTVAPEDARSASRAPVVAVAVAAVATAGVVALVLPGPGGPPAVAAEAPACQGARANCDLRLDEAFLPGTHNSYAAADEPGWYFANQRQGIARQLRDGIRTLLLDVHFGVRDPVSGRVRTDLAYEGSSRNKVVQALGRDAVLLADEIAGRVGRPLPDGERDLYLCHTLCELGADPLGDQLQLIRVFLAADLDDVVLLVIEPYVPPGRIAAAFAAAGLDEVAELDADGPLPTLGELVERDQRLVVMAEEDGGTPAWYHDAFSFIQDTPLGATTAQELRCARFRGGPGAPLLMLNHWVPPFPPSVRRNGEIGGAELEERIARCRRERDRSVSIVAVDFYERSDVVAIARRAMAARR